jgi:disease resistance protein RPM1
MKCAGIPLAIITMASLLADKPAEKWDELYRSIAFGTEDNSQAQNTMRIVSFSYYDLPAHLRTCLLYISAFPEDSIIPKDSLVWMWVAEGFVEKKQGMRLFEIGEGYFHDLINRSMIEAIKSRNDDSIVTGCHVHDMVLDFIRSMSHQENFFSVVLGNNDQTEQ